MGQTLTHGIYLPDEGERNCYSGLAANWQILDTSVGTIAEHTSALSGKAPLVHTHVKSDITDLLNSNFIPSANNSYDLGSSSYQWNNLYAKNYYYNGTAWGLDKENVWTNRQTYSTGFYGEMVWLKNTDLDLSVNGNTGLSITCQHMINWCDKNNTAYSTIQSWTNQYENVLVLRSKYRTDANTIRDLSVRFTSTATGTYIYPETSADTNLGTLNNRWKTLNGINPGALSLPNSPGGTGTENVNYYDLSGNITVRDGSAANGFTAPCDGWIAIGTFATWLQISNDTLILATTANPGSDGFAQAFLPVRKGNAIRVVVNQTNAQFQSFKLLPCEGNV